MGVYVRLVDYNSQQAKEDAFLSGGDRYVADSSNYTKIPGMPIAYWVSEALIHNFVFGEPLGTVASPKQGLATTENRKYLRAWWEIGIEQIGFGFANTGDAAASKMKWFPYNKGGDFRKWYGNDCFVVNYENDGFEIKQDVLIKYPYLKTPDFVVKNQTAYFQPSITWTLISSSATAFRYKPQGFLFDVAGMSMFPPNSIMKKVLAFCNTCIAYQMLIVLAPTLNYQVGDIARLPLIQSDYCDDIIVSLVDDNISLSKTDWDSFETSWDFKKHPLL